MGTFACLRVYDWGPQVLRQGVNGLSEYFYNEEHNWLPKKKIEKEFGAEILLLFWVESALQLNPIRIEFRIENSLLWIN